MNNRLLQLVGLCLLTVIFTGCATIQQPPIETAKNVDLERFMGSWYVIAHIPAPIEKEAYNAIESYEIADNGTIATTYTFNKGGFDGPEKTYNPHGFVVDEEHNSTWKMQFIWPFKAEYLISYVDDDYTETLISRNKRDYFWLMARTPTIPDSRYQALLDMLKDQGYDMSKTRKVPQNAR